MIFSRSQVEDTYAELEVGKLLALYGVAFKFRKPDGTPGGRNYDLEFFHPNGSRLVLIRPATNYRLTGRA